MKELLILSGKGGTGKTTIGSALIKLSKVNTFADCDVDAPNLHLLMGKDQEPKKSNYYGLPKAKINPDKCIKCNKCKDHCKFDAIYINEKYFVNPFACEGCGVCEFVCEVGAISMEESIDGDLLLYSDEETTFSTAKLKMGSGTSGMLVSQVKKQMRNEAKSTRYAIVDGSPGIGCPVIASISGADMVLIVAEPSLSGICDMKRIIKTTRGFGAKIGICINKYDVNLNKCKEIEFYCKVEGLPLLGKIPFDKKAVKAINDGKTIVDIDCASGRVVKDMYKKIEKIILDI